MKDICSRKDTERMTTRDTARGQKPKTHVRHRTGIQNIQRTLKVQQQEKQTAQLKNRQRLHQRRHTDGTGNADKTTVRRHHTPPGGNAKWRTHFGQCLTKLNTLLPYDSATTFLGTSPGELTTSVHTRTCAWAFTAAFCISPKPGRGRDVLQQVSGQISREEPRQGNIIPW